MKNNDFEIRTASLNAESQKLVGYAVRYNSLSEVIWDEFVEQFAPGAFAASLASGADCRALYEHDHMQLLGRTTSGTLVLTEDNTGLRFELTPPDTQLGCDVLTLVGRGDISGMSFAFRAISEEWNIAAAPYVRTVTAAELRDNQYARLHPKQRGDRPPLSACTASLTVRPESRYAPPSG